MTPRALFAWESESRLLLISTLLNAFFQLMIIQELRIGTAPFGAIIPLVLSASMACFGIGNVFARFLGNHRQKKIFEWGGPIAGAFILLSLGAMLLIERQALRMILSLASAFLTFSWFGFLYAVMLLPKIGNRASALSRVLALSSLLYLLGYLAGFYLSPRIGVNGGLVFAAAAAAALSSAIPFWFSGILAVALPFVLSGAALDARMETWRPQINLNLRAQDAALLASSDTKHVLGSWSLQGRLDVYSQDSLHRLVGLYNYRRSWTFGYGPQYYGKKIPWKRGDRVLIIGIGAGNPLAQTPSLLEAQVTGVEINGALVDFLRNQRPELNDGLFQKIKVLPYEGRAALDQLQEKQDFIVYEFPNTQSITALNLDADWIITDEAVIRVFSLLNPSGMFIVMLNNPARIRAIMGSLVRQGIPYRLFSRDVDPWRIVAPGGQTIPHNSYAIWASRNDLKLLEKKRHPDLFSVNGPADKLTKKSPSRLTDDHPYLVNPWRQLIWHPYAKWTATYSDEITRELQFVRVSVSAAAYSACGILLIAIGVAFSRPRRPGPSIYFFLIGVGFVCLQLFFLEKFRSLLNNALHTAVAVNSVFFAFSSLGGLAAPAILNLGSLRRLGLIAAALACSAIGVTQIPFSAQSLLLRWASIVLIVSPMAFAAGTMYPAGLMACDPHDGSTAMLLDALGTFCGFVLFFLIAWQFGLQHTFICLSACYLAAAALSAFC